MTLEEIAAALRKKARLWPSACLLSLADALDAERARLWPGAPSTLAAYWCSCAPNTPTKVDEDGACCYCGATAWTTWAVRHAAAAMLAHEARLREGK